MSEHSTVNPGSLPAPKGYSHGILTSPGKLLFIAGQVGWDRDEKLVSPDFIPQFRKALANVLEVVHNTGGLSSNIMRLTYYVTDKADYDNNLEEVGRVYRELMGRNYPASTLLEVSGLVVPGARIEIEATAVV